MSLIDFFTGIPNWLSLFAGAFSYPLVAPIFFLCLVTGVMALIVALSRHNHDNTQSKRVVMGCVVVMATTIALGMWSFSTWKADQERFLSDVSPLSR